MKPIKVTALIVITFFSVLAVYTPQVAAQSTTETRNDTGTQTHKAKKHTGTHTKYGVTGSTTSNKKRSVTGYGTTKNNTTPPNNTLNNNTNGSLNSGMSAGASPSDPSNLGGNAMGAGEGAGASGSAARR